MADMQLLDVMSLQWPDNLCNGILWMIMGEERGDSARRGDELRKANLNKTRSDLKQLALSRLRWRVGVVDALCPGRDQGN